MALGTSAQHQLGRRVADRRIVGTVNLRMAVQAAATLPQVDDVLAIGGGVDQRRGQAGGSTGNTGLAGNGTDTTGDVRRMALLAQQRGTGLEHAGHGAAMWVVAVGAVLGHRLMLVHKGAAFLGVAGVAGGVGAVTLGQFGAGRAVHVVAVGAAHLAFGNRVMRRLVQLGALFLVAGVADLGLGCLVQHLVAVGVNLVAGVAGQIGIFVLAAGPQGAFGILAVASQAGGVALARRRGVGTDEHAVRARSLFYIAGLLGVGRALAVAGDAVGYPLVGRETVRRSAHVRQIFLIMAGDTELGAGLTGGPGGRGQQREQAQADDGD